ncbi:MAG: anaerobic sulfatase maturase [Planctomycetota bacterium]
MQPFTLLIKPSGSDCNLDCKYCFYKHRASDVGQGRQRMSDEVLEKLIKDYMQLKFPLAGFAWQGGEPTLMGLDFYKKVVELQKKYGSPGQQVGNSLQTNAVLIDDQWGPFLHENNFLIGISIDGPKEFNDYYRLDHSGAGTYDKVLRAIKTCKEHKVEFNTLTLLNNINADHPDRVFDFLIENGVKFLQFIPCVELDPATDKVTDFSITPPQFGEFLCRIFDRWYEYGPTKLSIRDFDSVLSYYVAGKHTICTFDKQCSQYIVIEHTGDAFTCDFFVEPKWRLGNIFETPIEQLAASSKKRTFALAKQNLCNKCLVCRHLAICRGGCMKDRAPFDRDSFGKESYFCESYKRFFDHTNPKFMQLAAEINASAPAKTQPFA